MMMRSLALAGALILAAGAGAHAQERVSIGTGGTGGVFYAIGAGMAEILSNNMEGATANAEVTGASIENIRRVSAGQMTIGFSSASTLFEGKNGEGAFDGEPQNVAAIAALYPAVLQVAATKKSGATSIADLADLDISIGPPGSNSSVLSERLLTAYDAFNMSNVSFLSYGEATQALKNGQLDGTMILAGTPAAAFIELFTTEDVTLVPVTEADVAGLLEQYPFYALTDVPAGTYEGQDAAVAAIGDPAILFVAADADEALVYNITATLFGNLAALQGVHPAASAITLAGAPKTPVPLHAGAKRYFDEQ